MLGIFYEVFILRREKNKLVEKIKKLTGEKIDLHPYKCVVNGSFSSYELRYIADKMDRLKEMENCSDR